MGFNHANQSLTSTSLHQKASWNSYAPHVMQADANLTHIVSCDLRDQTDDSFYLIAAWGLYVNRTKDYAMEELYYPLLKGYSKHYLAPGARSFGFGGVDPSKPHIGGGVLYWNDSLSLLWNPNLEHSRLGSYWYERHIIDDSPTPFSC